jgi:hypothetical protein
MAMAAERDERRGEKHRTQSSPARDQAEPRTAEPKRHVENDRIGAHREAAASRRSSPQSLDAEDKINERIAKAGKCGPGRA